MLPRHKEIVNDLELSRQAILASVFYNLRGVVISKDGSVEDTMQLTDYTYLNDARGSHKHIKEIYRGNLGLRVWRKEGHNTDVDHILHPIKSHDNLLFSMTYGKIELGMPITYILGTDVYKWVVQNQALIQRIKNNPHSTEFIGQVCAYDDAAILLIPNYLFPSMCIVKNYYKR